MVPLAATRESPNARPVQPVTVTINKKEFEVEMNDERKGATAP